MKPRAVFADHEQPGTGLGSTGMEATLIIPQLSYNAKTARRPSGR